MGRQLTSLKPSGVDARVSECLGTLPMRSREPMAQRSIRLPAEIWERIKVHADKLSAQMGGSFIVTDSDAIRDVLAKNLPPLDAPPAEAAPGTKPASKARTPKGSGGPAKR